MKNHKLISRFIPLLLVVIFSSSCSVIFSNRRTAYRQIDEIKNSFVLVRLKSSQKKVQYLKLNNRDSEVNEEIAKIEKENEEIKKAFREEYKFSDFYFFDSSDYANIKSRAFDKVEITDRDDNLVNDKSFLENDFYIISFEGAYETQFVKTNPDGTRDAAGGTKRQAEVAVLDHEFIQLIKPFPYSAGMTRGIDALARPELRDGKNGVVNELNQRLNNFYTVSYPRIQRFRTE